MSRSLLIVHLFVVASVSRKGETAGMYSARGRWLTKALTLSFLLCLFAHSAHAQEPSGVRPAEAGLVVSGGSAESPGCVKKVDEGGEKPQCIREKIKSLRLGPAGRMARGLQYEYKLNEQPGTVFISSGQGNAEVSAFLRNPQKYLQQHTFTFKFAELFTDRLSLFKRGSEYLKANPQAAQNYNELPEFLCGNKPLITCLAKGGGWWQRALMGTSVNASFSQRALVQQGIIATPTKFGKDYQVTTGFVFDPAKLFPTATSWKGAFDDVKNTDKTLALLGAADLSPGHRRPWEQPWAAAVIPKVEFKVISQFDYLKYQGALIEAPFRNRALNTWTFTWDLTRAIPDTKSRIDAEVLDEALANLKNNLGRTEEDTWQKRCILHPSQVVGGLTEVRELNDLHPAFKAESCQELARFMIAAEYQLSCVKGKDKKTEERVDGTKTVLDTDPALPSPNECKWERNRDPVRRP